MVSTRNFSVKCFTGHCKKKQRQRSILKLGGGGVEGGLSSLSHAHTCTEIFQNTLGNLHSIQSVCTDREGIKEREDGEKG